MAINRIGNAVRRGFTLVELLVVIGIIALLISILLPALNRARSSASSLKCLANLKQLATAAIMYQNDNKGVLPPIAYEGNANGNFWPNALVAGKYVFGTSNSSASNDRGRQSVFQCPQGDITARWNNGDFTTGGIPPKQIADYGQMNFRNGDYGATNPNSIVTSNYAANGVQAYGGNFKTGINGRPISEFFPFVTVPTLPLATGYFPSPNAAKVAGIKQSALIVTFFDGLYCHDRNTGLITLRHGKPNGIDKQRSCNFAFLDGHAETISADDMPLTTRDSVPFEAMYNNSKLNTNNNGLWKIRFIVKPTT